MGIGYSAPGLEAVAIA